MWMFIVVAVFICGLYWFKVHADNVESDSEGMVEPRARQPYGGWVWTIVRGRSRD